MDDDTLARRVFKAFEEHVRVPPEMEARLLQRIEHECGSVERDLDGTDGTAALTVSALDGALALARSLREALLRYGEHDGDCAASVVGAAGDAACTCGYDAACARQVR